MVPFSKEDKILIKRLYEYKVTALGKTVYNRLAAGKVEKVRNS